jgi:hypothetical protein
MVLISTGMTSGEVVVGVQPARSSGTVGAAGQVADPEPGGELGALDLPGWLQPAAATAIPSTSAMHRKDGAGEESRTRKA